MSATVFRGAAIFDGARLLEEAALVVEEGRVVALVPQAEAPPGETVLLAGGVLAPGFLDLQVNGGGGLMLGDAASVEGIAAICDAHARFGATGILPTLITDTPEVTRAVVEAGIAAAEAGLPGFLGLHLEGPHLDPRRKGAHDPALIRPMTDADLALLVEAARRLPALMVTLAPVSATPQQIAALSGAGAVVSLGHSEEGYAASMAAFAAGARCVTHLFNAMSPLGHREPGLVGAALDAADAYAGLIADGIHVAPPVLRLALAAKRQPDHVFLVSDAMAVAGTDLAAFSLKGRRILRRDGRLTLADGTLAGADIDLPASIRFLVEQVGLALPQALRMASAIPAACLARPDLGHLGAGAPADLVHLGPDLGLRAVWRRGQQL
ncbi:MAG: N-acetylglucosamine-6-phosphate deacetylase [Amaricoccus sp.]